MHHLRFIPLKFRILTILAALSLFVGIALVLYQQAAFLRSEAVDQTVDQPSLEFSILPDSLNYLGYSIVRTLDAHDSTYGVAIFKNGERVWNSREGTLRAEYNEVNLVSLLQDDTKQVFVQQFSGGANCCWTSLILELRDSVRTLFNSDDYTDLGYELGMSDLDRDGMPELYQTLLTFDYFDRLDHSISPFSTAYFNYSTFTQKFILVNRKFSKLILSKTKAHELRVKAMADTTDFAEFDDIRGDYLSSVMQVLVDHVFAGQKENGWRFFESWYRLPDKDDMRQKIQQTLEASNVYQELYPE